MAKGRPTKYSDELADKICQAVSRSEYGLYKICEQNPDFPSVTSIMNWLSDEKHDYFVSQYARARELQADYVVDQAIEILDDTSQNDTPFTGGNHVQRDKARADIRKWKAARLAPKKYGDNIQISPAEGSEFKVPPIVFRFEEAKPE